MRNICKNHSKKQIETFQNIIAFFMFPKQKKMLLFVDYSCSLTKNWVQWLNLLFVCWGAEMSFPLKSLQLAFQWNTKPPINARLASPTFFKCVHFMGLFFSKCQHCRQLLGSCQQRRGFAMVECHLQLVRILISPSDRLWCLIKAAGSIHRRNLPFEWQKEKWDNTVITVNVTSSRSRNFSLY